MGWKMGAGSTTQTYRLGESACEINNRRFNKLNNLSTESKFLSYSHNVCTPFLPFDFHFYRVRVVCNHQIVRNVQCVYGRHIKIHLKYATDKSVRHRQNAAFFELKRSSRFFFFVVVAVIIVYVVFIHFLTTFYFVVVIMLSSTPNSSSRARARSRSNRNQREHLLLKSTFLLQPYEC